jgi:hypothetical protein
MTHPDPDGGDRSVVVRPAELVGEEQEHLVGQALPPLEELEAALHVGLAGLDPAAGLDQGRRGWTDADDLGHVVGPVDRIRLVDQDLEGPGHVPTRVRTLLPPGDRLLGDPQLVSQLALGHPVPMAVGADPVVESLVGLWCVLVCIHQLSTVDPRMVLAQGAIPESHTSMVELQPWGAHAAGMSEAVGGARTASVPGVHQHRDRCTDERDGQQRDSDDPVHGLPSSGRADCSPPSPTVGGKSKNRIRGSPTGGSNQVTVR